MGLEPSAWQGTGAGRLETTRPDNRMITRCESEPHVPRTDARRQRDLTEYLTGAAARRPKPGPDAQSESAWGYPSRRGFQGNDALGRLGPGRRRKALHPWWRLNADGT